LPTYGATFKDAFEAVRQAAPSLRPAAR
jgi:hypothetical protein